MTRLLLLTVLASCASKVERWCDAYVERMHACTEAGLPGGVRDALREQCVAMASYERAASDTPGNLAEIMKGRLEACSPALACADFTACLEERGCRILIAPSGGAQLGCTP